VTTEEFVALAERVSGQDLSAFFDEWLFIPARPASLGTARATARSAAASSSSVARAVRALESRRR
jgi:CubicO group peptidase (beta-lactamase class C family)